MENGEEPVCNARGMGPCNSNPFPIHLHLSSFFLIHFHSSSLIPTHLLASKLISIHLHSSSFIFTPNRLHSSRRLARDIHDTSSITHKGHPRRMEDTIVETSRRPARDILDSSSTPRGDIQDRRMTLARRHPRDEQETSKTHPVYIQDTS